MPFLLPLLYQVGLGFTPIQSGLLIMPQALAAMSTKFHAERILARFGYRGVLISNTVILGLLLMLFATIGMRTPVWLIVVQAFAYGAFTSLQYTSMNTLVYADIDRSANQQCQLHRQHDAAAVHQLRRRRCRADHCVFHSRELHSNPEEMIHGIHEAFIALGVLTILSTLVFTGLKSDDGADVSQQKDLHPGG